MPDATPANRAENTHGWEAASQAAAQIVRHRSGQGQLATDEDILEELIALNLVEGDSAEARAALIEILPVATETHGDLQVIRDHDGNERYYSSQFMTEAYARLLVRKAGDPRELIAEIVRENSSLYPRPFPLGAFERSPFNLTRAESVQCLERMSQQEAYQDIARTTAEAECSGLAFAGRPLQSQQLAGQPRRIKATRPKNQPIAEKKVFGASSRVALQELVADARIDYRDEGRYRRRVALNLPSKNSNFASNISITYDRKDARYLVGVFTSEGPSGASSARGGPGFALLLS